MQYGHIAIGTPGDDENAKRFLSLHAVQRHMVDRNQCKMAFEDNEGEYDDFYEYGDELSAAGASAYVSKCQRDENALRRLTGLIVMFVLASSRTLTASEIIHDPDGVCVCIACYFPECLPEIVELHINYEGLSRRCRDENPQFNQF